MNWQTYIKSFQSYLKIERSLSANTIANYSFDLLRLTNYLEAHGISKNPITIGEEEIQLFIYAVSKEVNPRSQARIISGLKSYISYISFEDYWDDNQKDLIEKPKICKKLPDTLYVQEIQAFIQAIDLTKE